MLTLTFYAKSFENKDAGKCPWHQTRKVGVWITRTWDFLSISGPCPRSKQTQPRGAKFLNPFSSVYESDRVDDVPLKARRAICSLVEGTLH